VTSVIFGHVNRSCYLLTCLLPPPRDPAVTSRPRKATAYPKPSLRTKRYCSIIYSPLRSVVILSSCVQFARTYTRICTVLLLPKYFCCVCTAFCCVVIRCVTVKSSFLIPRLHDTTGCQAGWITGWTTGCIVQTSFRFACDEHDHLVASSLDSVRVSSGSGARRTQNYMKLFVAHKMTRNRNTLNKVHVAATELPQLLLQNIKHRCKKRFLRFLFL